MWIINYTMNNIHSIYIYMKNKRILTVSAFEIIHSFCLRDIYLFFSFLYSSYYITCAGNIIAIDSIITSDNIAALALKALLEYNRKSTEIKKYICICICFAYENK